MDPYIDLPMGAQYFRWDAFRPIPSAFAGSNLTAPAITFGWAWPQTQIAATCWTKEMLQLLAMSIRKRTLRRYASCTRPMISHVGEPAMLGLPDDQEFLTWRH